jgi:hypothetical protein
MSESKPIKLLTHELKPDHKYLILYNAFQLSGSDARVLETILSGGRQNVKVIGVKGPVSDAIAIVGRPDDNNDSTT